MEKNEVIKDKREESKKISRIIDEMTLMNDVFMSKVFNQNIPATKLLISTILGQEVEIISAKGQWDIKSYKVDGRGIRLDIYARDSNGRYFDCEVQRDKKGASPRRARYYSAMIDSGVLKKGQNYDSIDDSYVIFITESDYFKQNKAVYHIDRTIDTKELFQDGNHILYVNASYRGDDDLGRLLEDMNNRETSGFNYKEIKDVVRYYKVEQEGREIMRDLWDETIREQYNEGVQQGIQQGVQQGVQQGTYNSRTEALKNIMKNLKLTAEQAMDAMGIPQEERGKYIAML